MGATDQRVEVQNETAQSFFVPEAELLVTKLGESKAAEFRRALSHASGLDPGLCQDLVALLGDLPAAGFTGGFTGFAGFADRRGDVAGASPPAADMAVLGQTAASAFEFVAGKVPLGQLSVESTRSLPRPLLVSEVSPKAQNSNSTASTSRSQVEAYVQTSVSSGSDRPLDESGLPRTPLKLPPPGNSPNALAGSSSSVAVLQNTGKALVEAPAATVGKPRTPPRLPPMPVEKGASSSQQQEPKARVLATPPWAPSPESVARLPRRSEGRRSQSASEGRFPEMAAAAAAARALPVGEPKPSTAPTAVPPRRRISEERHAAGRSASEGVAEGRLGELSASPSSGGLEVSPVPTASRRKISEERRLRAASAAAEAASQEAEVAQKNEAWRRRARMAEARDDALSKLMETTGTGGAGGGSAGRS